MKHLPLIFVAGLILSACNSEESDIFSYMEKVDNPAMQTRDKEENDSTGNISLGFNLESEEFEEEIEEVYL